MRVFGLSFLLIFSFTAYADTEASLAIKAEIDKASVTIGEPVEYRVTLTHDPEIELLTPLAPPPSPGLEIKEVHDFSERQGRKKVEGRRFILTPYELGEFILEPVAVRYRTPDGKEKEIQTRKLYLTVRSVNESGRPMTDIRDVKGVLEIPFSWGWLLALFLILTVGGGGVWAWWRLRHRPIAETAETGPVLSLEEEALLRLNRLFDSDLLKRGKVKEYFLELSEILRRYFEKRYEILAVESTTGEVLEGLKGKDIPDALQEKIKTVLEEADLAKFAKARPAAQEIVRLNRLSQAIIEEARPRVGV